MSVLRDFASECARDSSILFPVLRTRSSDNYYLMSMSRLFTSMRCCRSITCTTLKLVVLHFTVFFFHSEKMIIFLCVHEFIVVPSESRDTKDGKGSAKWSSKDTCMMPVFFFLTNAKDLSHLLIKRRIEFVIQGPDYKKD